jgi:hypothetical protein
MYIDDLKDKMQVFDLEPADFALLNPNTLTTPLFRTSIDAELTKQIYRSVPILIQVEQSVNLWNVSFSTMFHMSNDSNLFFSEEVPNSVRLYEARMIWHFDHRWTSYKGSDPENPLEQDKQSPEFIVNPQYWISNTDMLKRSPQNWERKWFICFREVTDSRNVRSIVSSIIPYVATNNKLPIIMPSLSNNFLTALGLVANLDSFVCDYVGKQKIGGLSLSYFILQQLPVIPPHTYTPPLLDFIVPRVLELTYTARDLQPFAHDVGYKGAPFVWDEERRFLMRCELDALYFHLYQIARDDVDYILETFPIVKRKDEEAHGEYLTKRIILEMYDQMAALPTMNVPAPKDDGEYVVPDVAQWQTWLTPEPASPLVAHRE